MGMSPSTGVWSTFNQNQFLYPQKLPIVNNPPVKGLGLMISFFSSMLECCWFCTRLMQETTDAVSSWLQWLWNVQKTPFHPGFPQPVTLNLSIPSSSCSLSLGEQCWHSCFMCGWAPYIPPPNTIERKIRFQHKTLESIEIFTFTFKEPENRGK